jgi:hypothetical protein
MKVVSEYLEHARHAEYLAREEKVPDFKAQLLKQADAYRKLAAERAKKLNLPPSEH